MSKPAKTVIPQPVIFDYSTGVGLFVANFGWMPGAVDNAMAVMNAMDEHPRLRAALSDPIERLEDWLAQGGPNDVSEWPEIARDIRSVLTLLGNADLRTAAEGAPPPDAELSPGMNQAGGQS